jgi:hypothetical protein
MPTKFKFNLPISSIATDNIPVEVDLDEQALGGALAMLVQQKTAIDDEDMAKLYTDHAGNVYILDSVKTTRQRKVKESPSVAALVDAMNVLLFHGPKKVREDE